MWKVTANIINWRERKREGDRGRNEKSIWTIKSALSWAAVVVGSPAIYLPCNLLLFESAVALLQMRMNKIKQNKWRSAANVCVSKTKAKKTKKRKNETRNDDEDDDDVDNTEQTKMESRKRAKKNVNWSANSIHRTWNVGTFDGEIFSRKTSAIYREPSNNKKERREYYESETATMCGC